VPGASVAFIDGGQVVWSSAFGIRDARQAGSALAADDPFRLRAPLHLLAIAACDRLQQANQVDLAAVIQQAADYYARATANQQKPSPNDLAGGKPSLTGNVAQSNAAVRATASPDQVVPTSLRGRSYSRGSVYGMLRLTVETASAQTFARFCGAALIGPMNLSQTDFDAGDRESRIVLGHSHLGSPLRPSLVADEFADGGCVFTTAADLARLIASTMAGTGADDGSIFIGDRPDDGEQQHGQSQAGLVASPQRQSHSGPPRLAGLAQAIDLVTRVDAAIPGGLGLALQRTESPDGVWMDLTEVASGIVCLARWHPSSGRGIVVLCNSATAKPAAERIAHTALGGN
jgi:CubicO group peptidase (beta-lactamase class C family)